jgi:PAS domain S-box-containing protein
MQAISRALPVRPLQLFWPIVLLLALVSTIAIFSTYRLLHLYQASVQSQQALIELEGFLSDLKDVETGVRGYALTNDRRFLEPYHAGKRRLDDRMRRLDELAQQEPSLNGHLKAVKPVALQRTELAGQVVEEVAAGTSNGELRQLLIESKTSMDQLRREVASAGGVLRSNFESRQRTVRRQAIAASLSLGAGVALSVAVLIWLFSLLRREIGRRREVEGELRVLNADLEQRVHERTREVEESRHLLNEVVENLPDMVLLKKPKGDGFEYVLINAAGERLLGRKREDVIGKTERDLFPEEEAENVLQTNRAVIESGRARTFNDRKLTTPYGVRTVETRMVPMENGSKMLLALIRDVTEHKSLETQVREMQRLDAVGQLTGGVAHDFNNLLAVIVGSVELVRDKLPDGSEMAAFADEAISAAMRGADLVRRLLAFARKQHLEPTAVDLNERLPSIVPLLQRTLGENIQLQAKSGDKLWQARIDPTQFDDALVNMAINARDAMPAGGTLTIETGNVELDEDYAAHHMEVDAGDYVMLAVSDTGHGMPPETIARAFEPFFTTKEEGKGTGLGLSQVFGWVKQSGGHIKIYSEVGHGTTVKLYLPRAESETEEVAAPQAAESSTRGHETILVVEDNPNVRRTVKRQLVDLGYSVIEAQDAEAALDLIRSGEDFDLMLTDVVMPGGMGGYQLAREAEKIRPAIRVIFTSGYTELAVNGHQAARKGTLLSKPYTKRDLGRAIRSALDEGGSPPS